MRTLLILLLASVTFGIEIKLNMPKNLHHQQFTPFYVGTLLGSAQAFIKLSNNSDCFDETFALSNAIIDFSAYHTMENRSDFVNYLQIPADIIQNLIQTYYMVDACFLQDPTYSTLID